MSRQRVTMLSSSNTASTSVACPLPKDRPSPGRITVLPLLVHSTQALAPDKTCFRSATRLSGDPSEDPLCADLGRAAVSMIPKAPWAKAEARFPRLAGLLASRREVP
jgi:hypothetical protein